ncbi:MAG: hypothetical protein JO265_06110 [Acidimicrobiia bacterium]|nr:hypothetical protein [Acidimicrobiia bacterium]
MKRHALALASTALLVLLMPAAGYAIAGNPGAHPTSGSPAVRSPIGKPTTHAVIGRPATHAVGGGPTTHAVSAPSPDSVGLAPEHDPMQRVRFGLAKNWAGYIAHGGPFSSVSTTWTEPSVSCTGNNSAVASFAGLDGSGSPTVEQIGTVAMCAGGGVAHFAFFEMFPKAAVGINHPVSAGDTLTATVVANSPSSFTLSLVDSGKWQFSTQQTARKRAQRASAEAITEAPTLRGKGIVNLADFGTINYSGTTVNGSPIGNFNPEAVTMVSNSGATKAQPSALSGGTAFSVTFVHS